MDSVQHKARESCRMGDMNDPPQKNWSTLVYCPIYSQYSPLDPAHVFILRAMFSCTGYVPDLFLGDREFSVSKSCSPKAAPPHIPSYLKDFVGCYPVSFRQSLSARSLSCCPLKPLKSLSSTHRAVPQAGGARRGGTNSAGLTVSKSFPQPSTVTIDSSLRPDRQPLRSADPEEVNKRKSLEVCATNFHRGVIAKWV